MFAPWYFSNLYKAWSVTLLFCWFCTSPSISFPIAATYLRQQPSNIVFSTAPSSREFFLRKRKLLKNRNLRICTLHESLNDSSSVTPILSHRPSEGSSGKARLQQQFNYIIDGLSIILFSVTMACLVISWEDLTCKYVLPSRHRTSISLYQTTPLPWGASTINGMGFGITERQMLLTATTQQSIIDTVDPVRILPSYNEVMLRHRTETIPHWKRTATPSDIRSAIRTFIAGIQQIEKLKSIAEDYQWDEIRLHLHAPPISDLALQSAVLRQSSNEMNEIVGFDWGSCAWRHCGAIADIQEALDELDQLLGVLEPYEAVFCLDIVERSLRDVLAVVPWQYASDEEKMFYASLPSYIPKLSTRSMNNNDSTPSRIDDAYFKALQELRID